MEEEEAPSTKHIPEGINHEYFKSHQCHLPADKMSMTYGRNCGVLRRFLLELTTVRSGDIRARNMYKSYAALCAEKARQSQFFPFSIHPFSRLRIWCEAYFCITMLVSNTLLTCHYSEPNPKLEDHNYIIMCIFDLMFIFNVIMNLFTGYIEGDTCQFVVLDLRRIWCKYATTWLIVDCMAALSCLPTLLIDSMHILPHLILVSLKLLRMPFLMSYLDNVTTVLGAGVNKKALSQILVLIYSYLTWNMFFQFAVEYVTEGTYQPDNPRACSWLSISKLWNDTENVRFVYAFDRAVGMLRKNTNVDLLKRDGCSDNFFVVSWFIAKLLIYHGALTYIVRLFSSESGKSKYFIMTQQVETYMTMRQFPPRIKQKIMKFYAIRYQSIYYAESKMLACMTGQLREDIIMHTGRQLVRELVFLKQLPRSLLLQIGLKLRIVIFIAGDIIFKINTVGDCLYFIDKGTVAIYSESGSEICHLEDGDFFGEIALIMKHCFRTASAVAVSNCELFRLDKEEFNNSIACYPTVYETIKRVAINRFERTCVLDEHHKTELIQRAAMKSMGTGHRNSISSDDFDQNSYINKQ